MPLSKILAAVGISLLAIAGAAACDDYDEEMAVEAARAAAKVALSQAVDGKSVATGDTSVSARSEPTEVAAVEQQSAPASMTATRMSPQ